MNHKYKRTHLPTHAHIHMLNVDLNYRVLTCFEIDLFYVIKKVSTYVSFKILICQTTSSLATCIFAVVCENCQTIAGVTKKIDPG